MPIHPELQSICDALRKVAVAIDKATAETRNFCLAFGWNMPALTKHDLIAAAENLADSIERAARDVQIDESLELAIDGVSAQIEILVGNTVPQMFANNGNGPPAIAAYLGTILGIEQLLRSLLIPSWESLGNPELMPKKLATKVRAIDGRIKQIEPNLELLASQVREIKDAHAAAESLPLDLEQLREARRDISVFHAGAASDTEKVVAAQKKAVEDLEKIENAKNQAMGLISQLQELHRIGTSTTLAGAFQKRADRLEISVIVSGLLLIAALTAGVFIGANRITAVNMALEIATKTEGANWNAVWVSVALTVMSVGAPIWLAWVATKQIAQRFKLAEDYAYKASISNAYEGYRREAVQLDEEFQARLFGSALTRLDELPLRLVDDGNHGSPLHELINSLPFKEAMEKIPGFKDKFISSVKGLFTDEKSTTQPHRHTTTNEKKDEDE